MKKFFAAFAIAVAMVVAAPIAAVANSGPTVNANSVHAFCSGSCNGGKSLATGCPKNNPFCINGW